MQGPNLQTNSNFAKDPICEMPVSPQSEKWRSEFEGKTYLFCSLDCKSKFDQNSKNYISYGKAYN